MTGHRKTTLERELTWGKNLICLYSDRLRPFFADKKSFEHYVMQGKYAEARQEIESIKQRYGCSLWSMEQEFLLYELEDGIEATKKFQNGLTFGCKNNWMNCFANFYSLKAERNLNNKQYNQRLDRALQSAALEIRIYFQMHLMKSGFFCVSLTDFRLKEFYDSTEIKEGYEQIHNLLMQCRTELQKELSVISKWFKLSTTQEHPDFDMKTLLKTCQATMRNINPSFDRADLTIEDETRSLWKGRTFSYFNEILTILFNNAFAHAGYKQNPEQLKITLTLKEDEWHLHIHMTTNLSVDAEEVKKRVLEVRENMERQANRFYGKDYRSGYIKIQNMLSAYISPEHDSFIRFGVDKPQEHFVTYIVIPIEAIKGSEQ